MKQLLSITLAFTLVRLISQPGAAQQAQPSPTPDGRAGRGGGTPPPIQAKPEELAKIKEKTWHISLHHPDRFAAAEIGAGTVSRTAQRPGLTPYQLATLRIWENISEWALNIHNLPLAGHDGENDPGQLESSLRARAQLEKEGFPSVGDPDCLRSQGASGRWMVSKETGHGTSPLVPQRLDAFLKEHGDKGQISPDHIRFLTYTTRYNRSYWVSLDGLEKHYERAEVDAQRTDGGASYDIKTKNLTRLGLHETEHVRE